MKNKETSKKIIDGVGPDAPITVNAAGGRQSSSPYRLDLMPPRALLGVAAVLKQGSEKYGDWNWLKIEAQDHLNHLLVHAYAWLSGDRSDDHESHVACRAMMFYEMALREKDKTQ